MKRLTVCLLIGILALGLAACGGSSSQKGETSTSGDPQTEDGQKVDAPVQKELTDPRGKTLESTATGEADPQLVEPVYETTDVIVAEIIPTEMGYAVDPTGETDSTAGLQKALYDCYYAGGGTVWLPVGNYAISDTVYIPPFVTLRGDWQDPDEGTEYGTIISVWMDPEDTDSAGAFRMGGSSAAIGLTVYYPLQTLDYILPYPYTFFVDAQAANKMSSTIRNVTVINGYRGIGSEYATAHECMQVENVKGTFLYIGYGVANSSDVGTVRNFTVSSKYWKEASADCMNAVDSTLIDIYMKKYVTGLQLGDLEWTEFNNVFIEGCAVGVRTVAGARASFTASFYDLYITDCEQGFVIDDMDSRWGVVIASSHIEGGIINNTEGYVKLTDVEVEGGITEKKEGSVWNDETSLDEYAVDYDTTYTKPASNMIVADLPNGMFTDAGPKLQEYLDEMASVGGGVVYVPGGNYRFSTPVTVPAGVELKGTAATMARDLIGFCNGTVFICYYGDDAADTADGQAFVTLAGENAGLNGIRIVYAENGPLSDDLSSTYAVRGTASGVYVVNCEIAGSAYGIDFYDCDGHYIDGVYACCYYNAFRVGGVGGTIRRCLQNGTVLQRMAVPGLTGWIQASGSDLFSGLIDSILRKESVLVIVEDAVDQVVNDVFAYGVRTSIQNVNSKNTYLNNIGADNIGNITPMILVEGGSVTGVNIMRYNGYSYDLVAGSIAFYNRIAINEVGEKTMIKEQ